MRHPSITASASSNTEGPSALSTKHKEALLTFLGIPTELPSQDPTSLRAAYAKFKVLVSSSKQTSNLRSNQEWTDHLEEFGIETNWFPVFADLANIFISKKQFYASWKPSFKKVLGYPKMVAWLNDDSDCDSGSELCGETKAADDYSLGDLKVLAWQERCGEGEKASRYRFKCREKGEEKEGQESDF